jgi:Sugar (and other) transporter
LAWFRKLPIDDPRVGEEFTEILATVKEERESRGPLRQCVRRGHWNRFVIAFTMFTLQQWSGQVCDKLLFVLMQSGVFDLVTCVIFLQNSIGYYAPQVFRSIGIGSTNATLFASGVYGLVKVIATTIFLFVGIEQFGRKRSLMGAS